MGKIYVFENFNNLASIVFDGTTLTDEEKNKAVIIDAIPETDADANDKTSLLKVSKENNKVWYEYKDIPKAIKDKDKETFTQTLAQLAVENKKKDEMIKQLVQTVNDLTIKVNKLGGTSNV